MTPFDTVKIVLKRQGHSIFVTYNYKPLALDI